MTTLNELRLDLKVLAQIQRGQKLRQTNGRTIIGPEDRGFFQSIQRKISRDSREKSIKIIENIISRTFDKIDDLLKSGCITIYENKKDPGPSEVKDHNITIHNIINLINDLIRASHGIENLKETYKRDATIISQIEIIMSNIESKRIEVENKLDDCHYRFIKKKLPTSETNSDIDE